MHWIKSIEEILELQFSSFSVVQQNEQTGEENKDGGLLSSRQHIGNQKTEDLPDTVFTGNVKSCDDSDSFACIVASNQPGHLRDHKHTGKLQNKSFCPAFRFVGKGFKAHQCEKA